MSWLCLQQRRKLTYRPFLVKEEKILLLAMEEEEDTQLNKALKQVVHNCTFQKVDVAKLPLFDLEYIFLRIRAKSVGEVAKLQVLCEDDGRDQTPLDYFTSIISRTIRGRSNMSIAKMCASLRGTIC